ncbi:MULTISPECIES: hypothetical protein [Paenibacillus]|uniref:hypothetical protein n=1 Tax=Paenibacillus TaxID=44249 RepID=UPI00203C9EBB|nr:hypothetical protein [Paenibacillus camelliae]MCM3633342.1 hypothetical protein [Paenibacillus camelliae]
MSKFTELSKSEMQQTNGGVIALAYLAVKGVAYLAASTAFRAAVVAGVKYVGAGITVGTVGGYVYNKVRGK